ncbi:hypothetical protein ACOMHN_027705 [Nucella lapillus]
MSLLRKLFVCSNTSSEARIPSSRHTDWEKTQSGATDKATDRGQRVKQSGATADAECAVCQDQVRQPCTVPCGNQHVFCLGCLQGLVTHSTQHSHFPCPLCRKRVRIPLGGVAAFRNNKSLGQKLRCKFPALSARPRLRQRRGQSGAGLRSSDFVTVSFPVYSPQDLPLDVLSTLYHQGQSLNRQQLVEAILEEFGGPRPDRSRPRSVVWDDGDQSDSDLEDDAGGRRQAAGPGPRAAASRLPSGECPARVEAEDLDMSVVLQIIADMEEDERRRREVGPRDTTQQVPAAASPGRSGQVGTTGRGESGGDTPNMSHHPHPDTPHISHHPHPDTPHGADCGRSASQRPERNGTESERSHSPQDGTVRLRPQVTPSVRPRPQDAPSGRPQPARVSDTGPAPRPGADRSQSPGPGMSGPPPLSTSMAAPDRVCADTALRQRVCANTALPKRPEPLDWSWRRPVPGQCTTSQRSAAGQCMTSQRSAADQCMTSQRSAAGQCMTSQRSAAGQAATGLGSVSWGRRYPTAAVVLTPSQGGEPWQRSDTPSHGGVPWQRSDTHSAKPATAQSLSQLLPETPGGACPADSPLNTVLEGTAPDWGDHRFVPRPRMGSFKLAIAAGQRPPAPHQEESPPLLPTPQRQAQASGADRDVVRDGSLLSAQRRLNLPAYTKTEIEEPPFTFTFHQGCIADSDLLTEERSEERPVGITDSQQRNGLWE